MEEWEKLEKSIKAMDAGDSTERPESNCRERILGIMKLQRETRDLLSNVVGTPIQDCGKDEENPVGALADMECGLRSVERHAQLLFDMVTDLHDRL